MEPSRDIPEEVFSEEEKQSGDKVEVVHVSSPVLDLEKLAGVEPTMSLVGVEPAATGDSTAAAENENIEDIVHEEDVVAQAVPLVARRPSTRSSAQKLAVTLTEPKHSLLYPGDMGRHP